MLIAPSPCPKITSLTSGTEFCLILMLSLRLKVNMGYMVPICLLSVHVPSFLMNSHKFLHPFHQYICDINPQVHKKLVLSPLREVDLRLVLPSPPLAASQIDTFLDIYLMF